MTIPLTVEPGREYTSPISATKRKVKEQSLTVVLRSISATHMNDIGKIEPSARHQTGHRILLALQQRPAHASLSRDAIKPATRDGAFKDIVGTQRDATLPILTDSGDHGLR